MKRPRTRVVTHEENLAGHAILKQAKLHKDPVIAKLIRDKKASHAKIGYNAHQFIQAGIPIVPTMLGWPFDKVERYLKEQKTIVEGKKTATKRAMQTLRRLKLYGNPTIVNVLEHGRSIIDLAANAEVFERAEIPVKVTILGRSKEFVEEFVAEQVQARKENSEGLQKLKTLGLADKPKIAWFLNRREKPSKLAKNAQQFIDAGLPIIANALNYSEERVEQIIAERLREKNLAKENKRKAFRDLEELGILDNSTVQGLLKKGLSAEHIARNAKAYANSGLPIIFDRLTESEAKVRRDIETKITEAEKKEKGWKEVREAFEQRGLKLPDYFIARFKPHVIIARVKKFESITGLTFCITYSLNLGEEKFNELVKKISFKTFRKKSEWQELTKMLAERNFELPDYIIERRDPKTVINMIRVFEQETGIRFRFSSWLNLGEEDFNACVQRIAGKQKKRRALITTKVVPLDFEKIRQRNYSLTDEERERLVVLAAQGNKDAIAVSLKVFDDMVKRIVGSLRKKYTHVGRENFEDLVQHGRTGLLEAFQNIRDRSNYIGFIGGYIRGTILTSIRKDYEFYWKGGKINKAESLDELREIQGFEPSRDNK